MSPPKNEDLDYYEVCLIEHVVLHSLSTFHLNIAVVANHINQANEGESTNKAEHSKEDIPSNCEVTCTCIKLGRSL